MNLNEEQRAILALYKHHGFYDPCSGKLNVKPVTGMGKKEWELLQNEYSGGEWFLHFYETAEEWWHVVDKQQKDLLQHELSARLMLYLVRNGYDICIFPAKIVNK